MKRSIEFERGGRSHICGVKISSSGEWSAGQLPAPDTRYLEPVCRLNVDAYNFHGRLEEDLVVIADNDDDPSAYLLWAAMSGDQSQDGVSRLALVGLVYADVVWEIADDEDEDALPPVPDVARVGCRVSGERRENGENALLEDTKPGDAWPSDLAQWDAFVEEVKQGQAVELSSAAQG